jgi:type II secretory pathway pseudopilin PulG
VQPRHPPGQARQRGAALMVMLIILVLGLAATLVSSLNSASLRNERQARTAAALAQAKDALIGYAVTYGDTHSGEVHGYFPCPDTDGSNGEGTSKSPTCGSKNVSQLGRLPWKTLDLPALRDGDGECLWYAVSGTYKSSPKTDLMNWDTNGQLQAYAADGTTRLDNDGNQVVAVIIAPGAAQEGQARSDGSSTCGSNYTPSAYLDNNAAHGINNADIAAGKFVQGTAGGDVNDRMVFITRDELWAAMQKRSDFANTLQLLTRRVAECLASYGTRNLLGPLNKSLPWPAPLALGDYGVNNNYNDSLGSYSGRVPHLVDTSNTATLNTMTGNSLMANNGLACPYYAATPATELQRLYPWWVNWKDHLFYALSREYRPGNLPTVPCGNCVTVNGGGNYAAVVMLAGSRLSGQVRASSTTDAQRSVITNYLEGRNASNHPNGGGNSDYQNEAASATFNDALYCVDTNLNVAPCP